MAQVNIMKHFTFRPMTSVPKKTNYKVQDINLWITEKEPHKKEELVFEDIDDDLDDSLAQLSLGSSQPIKADFDSKPISLEQAMALKNLIFGSATSCFNQEWRQQSFNFCNHYGLEYGIIQHKGGSCGVLAAVQAFVLKNILFGEQRKTDTRQCLQPSPRERTKALASSITEILWRAGGNECACVALRTSCK
ncbi:hypothetical protein QZH41_018316 [Actinostola sp. cb2023]|nr:hypothetical protein QZH41_018316 [Actinostola sp. cb2023]